MRDAGVLTSCFAPNGTSPFLKGWLFTNCQIAKCSFSFEARKVKSALPGLLNPRCATLPLALKFLLNEIFSRLGAVAGEPPTEQTLKESDEEDLLASLLRAP